MDSYGFDESSLSIESGNYFLVVSYHLLLNLAEDLKVGIILR